MSNPLDMLMEMAKTIDDKDLSKSMRETAEMEKERQASAKQIEHDMEQIMSMMKGGGNSEIQGAIKVEADKTEDYMKYKLGMGAPEEPQQDKADDMGLSGGMEM